MKTTYTLLLLSLCLFLSCSSEDPVRSTGQTVEVSPNTLDGDPQTGGNDPAKTGSETSQGESDSSGTEKPSAGSTESGAGSSPSGSTPPGSGTSPESGSPPSGTPTGGSTPPGSEMPSSGSTPPTPSNPSGGSPSEGEGTPKSKHAPRVGDGGLCSGYAKASGSASASGDQAYAGSVSSASVKSSCHCYHCEAISEAFSHSYANGKTVNVNSQAEAGCNDRIEIGSKERQACAAALGVPVTHIRVAGNQEEIQLDADQSLMVFATGNKTRVDLTVKSSEDEIHGICIFVAGNQAQVDLNVHGSVENVYIIERGNDAKVNVTLAEGGKIINPIHYDLPGKGCSLKVKGTSRSCPSARTTGKNKASVTCSK